MSVKETIHQWVDTLEDNSPGLLELYEEARLDLAIDEAKEDVRAGRVYSIEEVRQRFEERCRLRHSA